jgi:hypothetical protein
VDGPHGDAGEDLHISTRASSGRPSSAAPLSAVRPFPASMIANLKRWR